MPSFRGIATELSLAGDAAESMERTIGAEVMPASSFAVVLSDSGIILKEKRLLSKDIAAGLSEADQCWEGAGLL